MFVTASDFDVPPLAIPNLDKVINTFSDYVTAKEKEALLKLLGRDLYTQFMDGLEAAGDAWSETTTYSNGDVISLGNDVWTSLQAANLNHPVEEGSWWTLSEEDNKWLKLKNGATYLNSDYTFEWEGMNDLLKPYIFSYWLRDNFDSYTGVGVAIGNTENATVISPNKRIVSAYNDYADKAGAGCNLEDSLYGYLVANESDFPDWLWKDPGYMNVFNI